jgi:ABC-2 type transport system permease protein
MQEASAPVRSSPSTIRFFRLLFWMHWRSMVASVRGIRKKSRLLLLVLSAFLTGYLVVGYWLFEFGLTKLQLFPIVGTLLSQRILFLIFGFFFVMLVFSNLIIGYTTLFKNRETAWLLTLPVTHRNVYRWKFAECLVVSSWALIFLSAPMMAAYGRVHKVPALFYLKVVAAYLPFVVIPALLGSWAIVFLARILARAWVKNTLLVAAGVTLAAMIFAIKPIGEAQIAAAQDALSFDQLLRHTKATVNPALPSAWLARSITAWSQGLGRQGTFFFLVLLSNALLGALIGFEIVGRFFYGSWSVTASSRAERFQRRVEAQRTTTPWRSPLEALIRCLPFSKPVRALVLKDIKLFWRDPTQWTQFVIFFGLLCIYVLNLRNVAFEFHSPFWETIVSHLNLAASALTLSTLTTRFVFPQFSLEGRRLWIIGLAPIELRKILVQKFWLSCVVSSSLTIGLMVTSSLMLRLEMKQLILFAAQIGMMSATLCGVAVGLGALFPNLKEDNPSKIVSGFGGTLCLVVSFIYITCFVALAMMPPLRRVMGLQFFIPDGVVLGIQIVFSACVLFFPMIAAIRRTKNLEF